MSNNGLFNVAVAQRKTSEVIPLKISVVGNPSATKGDQESKKSRHGGGAKKEPLAEANIFRHTLPETKPAILHLKMDVSKYNRFLLRWPIFRFELSVFGILCGQIRSPRHRFPHIFWHKKRKGNPPKSEIMVKYCSIWPDVYTVSVGGPCILA